MNSNHKLFYVIIIILLQRLFAQAPDTLWTKTYGGIYWDQGFSIQQTSDGGFIIAGATWLGIESKEDVFLIKTNESGDTLWTKIYGQLNTRDVGRYVEQTTDGGYIITGLTNSRGAGHLDVLLIKTDNLGDTLWTKTYGGDNQDYGWCVQQTFDGGYIIAGYTESFGAGSPDGWLIKTNSSGDALWKKTFGGASFDLVYFVRQTAESGYIMTGQTFSHGSGYNDVWLIKTDNSGDTIWTKTIGGADHERGNCVQQTDDGGYIIVGRTESFSVGGTDVWLIKTNNMGDTLWTKTFGGADDEEGIFVQQTIDGGYIITGYSYDIEYDLWLIKTNDSGDTLWTRKYGGDQREMGYSVQQTKDGCYIIVGETSSYGAGYYDVWLIKTGPDISGISINQISKTLSDYVLHQNYPNPFNPITMINYQLPARSAGGPMTSTVELSIYNLLGQRVSTLVNERKRAGYHQVEWDASGYSTGIYYYQLKAGEFQDVKKMILIK